MKLQRLLLVAPLALMFAGVASAQTTGNIIGVITDAQSGKPIIGALVVATSPSSQGEQTAITDKSGAFRFQFLTPGDYKLVASFDGFKAAERSDLVIRVDKTIRANLAMVPEAVQMEEQVVRTGMAPVVNVASAESGTVVSKEFLSNVPGSRGFENIAIVTPTATFDALGVSFAGTTSNENQYLIDGLSVTDAAFGTLGGQILNNFVEEIDIKTGAFMPEYGFASGGIVSVVTKSGSNEFHGSVFGNWQPGLLQMAAKGTSRSGEALDLQKDNGSLSTYNADFGAEVGGPILKDRLWFYGGFANLMKHEQDIRSIYATTPGGDRILAGSNALKSTDDGQQYVGKVTLLINQNNTLAVTGIFAPGKLDAIFGSDVSGFTGTGNGSISALTTGKEYGFGDVVGRFTSKLLDKKLNIEVMGGYHNQYQNEVPVTVNGVNQATTSATRWSLSHPLSDFEAVPSACTTGGNTCDVTRYVTGGAGFLDRTFLVDRLSGRVSASYLFDFFGSHQAKAGFEMFSTTYTHGKAYGGNAHYTEVTVGPNSATTTLLPGNYLNLDRGFGVPSADRQSYTPESPKLTAVQTSQAVFLQDSYSPMDGLTINLGLRWEGQNLKVKNAPPGAPEINIMNNYAPRVQAMYDWTKQGRSKVSANWGRFYENIPLDLGDRAVGLETQYNAYVGPVGVAGSCVSLGNPAAVNGNGVGSPQSCAPIVNAYKSAARGLYTYGQVGSPYTEPVAPNLQGQYSDTYGAAVEYEVISDLSAGIEYIGRRIGSVIEDASTDDGATYFISNPGTGKPFSDGAGGMIDPINVVAVDPVTGASYHTKFPKPTRDYDAVSFTLKKNYSNHWQGMASYTYSYLRGNYPGLYSSTNGQADPNISSQFDLVGLLSNQSGLLPADRPHQIKVYGSYTASILTSLSVSAGVSVRAQSGTPVNYLAAGPLNSGYGPNEAFVLQRGSGGRTPFTTFADLRGQVEYTIRPPYAVKLVVDVTNVFNSLTAMQVDQAWTNDSVPPIGSSGCSGRNAMDSSNKIAAAIKDCPALGYLRTQDGLVPTINKNWGQATQFAAPLAVRVGLQFTF